MPQSSSPLHHITSGNLRKAMQKAVRPHGLGPGCGNGNKERQMRHRRKPIPSSYRHA